MDDNLVIPGTAAPAPEPVQRPGRLHLDELHAMTHAALLERAENLRMRVTPDRSRHHLILDLMKYHASRGGELQAEGVLEMTSDHQAFLRWPRYSFKPVPEDVAVPRHILQRLGLQVGYKFN